MSTDYQDGWYWVSDSNRSGSWAAALLEGGYFNFIGRVIEKDEVIRGFLVKPAIMPDHVSKEGWRVHDCNDKTQVGKRVMIRVVHDSEATIIDSGEYAVCQSDANDKVFNHDLYIKEIS